MKYHIWLKNYLILFFILPFYLSAQNEITKVYLFPGQGSDERVFSNIRLDSSFQKININYPVPEKGTSMKEYAANISKQIDTTEKFILIGLSFGGMICTELADILHPEKTIIISSAKCSSELPRRYTVMKKYPIYKLYPKRFVKWGAVMFQPTIEKDDKKNRAFFKDMVKKKDPQFMKQSFSMMINWDREKYSPNIIHIHGCDDHVLDIKNIKADYTVQGGTHLMTYMQGEEISKIIQNIFR